MTRSLATGPTRGARRPARRRLPAMRSASPSRHRYAHPPIRAGRTSHASRMPNRDARRQVFRLGGARVTGAGPEPAAPFDAMRILDSETRRGVDSAAPWTDRPLRRRRTGRAACPGGRGSSSGAPPSSTRRDRRGSPGSPRSGLGLTRCWPTSGRGSTWPSRTTSGSGGPARCSSSDRCCCSRPRSPPPPPRAAPSRSSGSCRSASRSTRWRRSTSVSASAGAGRRCIAIGLVSAALLGWALQALGAPRPGDARGRPARAGGVRPATRTIALQEAAEHGKLPGWDCGGAARLEEGIELLGQPPGPPGCGRRAASVPARHACAP